MACYVFPNQSLNHNKINNITTSHYLCINTYLQSWFGAFYIIFLPLIFEIKNLERFHSVQLFRRIKRSSKRSCFKL